MNLETGLKLTIEALTHLSLEAASTANSSFSESNLCEHASIAHSHVEATLLFITEVHPGPLASAEALRLAQVTSGGPPILADSASQH